MFTKLLEIIAILNTLFQVCAKVRLAESGKGSYETETFGQAPFPMSFFLHIPFEKTCRSLIFKHFTHTKDKAHVSYIPELL